MSPGEQKKDRFVKIKTYRQRKQNDSKSKIIQRGLRAIG